MYKRIGVKIDMKKHDEKRQGMTGSVSSKNHVKERKAKPKENNKRSRKRVKEIRQNTRQNEIELIYYGKNGVADKHRR